MQILGGRMANGRFDDDVLSLSSCEPRVQFVTGDRPREVATVVLDLVNDQLIYLSTKDRHGLGLYLKLYVDENGGRLPGMATDPACGPARQQQYEVFD